MPFETIKFRAARHSPRPRTGSNRHSRICSPIHFHYVTQPNPPPHTQKKKERGRKNNRFTLEHKVEDGALYMTGGGLPQKRGQLLSPLPYSIHFPFLIESSKPLHYWYIGQIEGCSSSPAETLFMRQCDAAEKAFFFYQSKLVVAENSKTRVQK